MEWLKIESAQAAGDNPFLAKLLVQTFIAANFDHITQTLYVWHMASCWQLSRKQSAQRGLAGEWRTDQDYF